MTTTDITREMTAIDSRSICGQIFVLSAHGGRPFLFGRFFVALKMANAVAIMERTMRLQAKLIPRRKIFAIRTRILIFCSFVSNGNGLLRYEEYVPGLWPVLCLSLPPVSRALALA